MLKSAQYKKFFSIRFKLIAAFLMMILPIAMLGYISQKLTSKAIEDHAVKSTTQTMNQMSRNLGLVFDMTEDFTKKHFSNSQVINYLKSNSENSDTYEKNLKKQEVEQLLSAEAYADKFVSDITIYSETEGIIGTQKAGENEDLEAVKEAIWYKEALNNNGQIA